MTYEVQSNSDGGFSLFMRMDDQGNGVRISAGPNEAGGYDLTVRPQGSVHLDHDGRGAYRIRRGPQLAWPAVLGFGLALGTPLALLLLSL